LSKDKIRDYKMNKLAIINEHSKYAPHLIHGPAPLLVSVSHRKSWAQLEKERAKRVKERWDNGKIRTKEIPPETINEMLELQSKLGLSYAKLASLYGLSRYIVHKAMTGDESEQTIIVAGNNASTNETQS
jgi:hypothetical protein